MAEQEIEIIGAHRNYLYGSDDQGEYGSLLEIGGVEDNPAAEEERLERLALELEEMSQGLDLLD